MNEQLNKTEARQGETGQKVRIMLAASCALAVIALVVVLLAEIV